MKILVVIGTRPEGIKMAPLVVKMRASKKDTHVCNTGQHGGILDDVLDFFGIESDFRLNTLKKGQSLTELTSKIMKGVENILSQNKYDWIAVHGDTTSCFASALAGFYCNVKILHVEAGLRTYSLNNPYPEEANRQLVARIASKHYCPTTKAKENLLSEIDINSENLIVTGNTVIDALILAVSKINKTPPPFGDLINEKLSKEDFLILITFHRRENHNKVGILIDAINDILRSFNHVKIFLTVHPNPKVKAPLTTSFSTNNRVTLMEPLRYDEFVWLMQKSDLIMTDSGGVQEEAPSLSKRVLVLRDITERPEAVEAGTVKLVGCDRMKILENVEMAINDKRHYGELKVAKNPYGDGKSCDRIVNNLLDTHS